MKKLILLILISVSVLSITNCSKQKEEKYVEEKKILDSLTQSTKRFTKEIEDISNRISLGRAITTYISEIKRYKPDMYKLEKLCPDFKTSYGYKSAPKDLQPAVKKFGDAMSLLKLVMEGKKTKFSQDKNLIKLFQEIDEVLYYY